MKRYIRSRSNVSFIGLIDTIDIIVFVNDARVQGLANLPIQASEYYGEDYDQYSIEELMELDDSTLRGITTFYALDKINDAIKDYGFDYKLTKQQVKKLSSYYRRNEYSEVFPTNQEIKELIELIKKCEHFTGPSYRHGQPEKNFAEMHGLDLTPSDYKAIVKSIVASEFYKAQKSYYTSRLGAIMYEFIHDPKNYRLKYSDQRIKDPIKIYIKLLPDYQGDCNVAIISFHDPDDSI